MHRLEHIHGGNITNASSKYGLPVEKMIDFSANINPLGPSRIVYSALTNSLGLISRYPDPDCSELRTILADFLGIRQDLILMGNGAAELIYLLVRVTKCKKALIPVPTFSEYGLAVLSQGGEVLEVSMDENNGFSLPVGKIISCLPEVDLLFICNPNNPTGCLVDRTTICYILEEASRHGVLVMVDEAFMDFVPQRSDFTVMPLVGRNPNLVVLYSMTKFFGIPGLRLGAVAAPGKLIKLMNYSKDPWNVNVLAQVAGVAGLRDLEHMEETNRLIKDEKMFLFDGLESQPGTKPLLGAANFLLADISETGLTSGELTDILGKRGILVRDCTGFSGLEGRYIRLAVKTRAENELLLSCLKAVLGG